MNKKKLHGLLLSTLCIGTIGNMIARGGRNGHRLGGRGIPAQHHSTPRRGLSGRFERSMQGRHVASRSWDVIAASVPSH